MQKGINRRDFLKWIGAGTAAASVPALGCATGGSTGLHRAAGREAGAHSTYFDGFGVDGGLIGKVIRKGLTRGGDFCDVFLQHKISHWVGMEDAAINRAYSNVDLGAGIRVLKGDATGFAYCEDLTEQAMLETAETAASVADAAAPGIRAAPLAARKIESRYTVELPWSEVGIDKKLPLIERANAKARGRDPRIIKVTIFLADQTSHILVANSEGLLVEDEQPMAVMYVTCVAAKDKQIETGYQSVSSRDGLRFFSPEVLDKLSNEAADYTTKLFDAVSAPVGELPVVLAPGVSGILLHEAMGHGMEADFNRKGVSIYADRIGKRVAPDEVTICDDGTCDRMRGSINIDDEGAPAQRTVLVEKGILRSYMHDRISAKHYSVASTGSGRRQSFRYPPVPRMRNTYMVSGPHDPAEIIASVDKGLYAEVFSNGQVHIGAGDFTFYLKHGRLIEKGKLTRVVKDANLIGSGPKVLEHVEMVGNDMLLFSGGGSCGKDGQRVPVGFGLPTVRVGAISIGGRAS
ncbi:MAG: twin-arginine translocation signal domain-containing protein [Deltaproteobacteria bacterium]|nr:twin-arginine translocation signal domain-containing protein [Deltaproteobacteria bacterium]